MGSGPALPGHASPGATSPGARGPLELGPLGAARAAEGGEGESRDCDPGSLRPGHARFPAAPGTRETRVPATPATQWPWARHSQDTAVRVPAAPVPHPLQTGVSSQLETHSVSLISLVSWDTCPTRANNLGPESHGGKKLQQLPGVPNSTELSWVGPRAFPLRLADTALPRWEPV